MSSSTTSSRISRLCCQATLDKSLRVLKPGGQLISLSGPPDPAFAEKRGLNLVFGLLMRLLSWGARKKARSLGVGYSFLFMRADGRQLGEIASLVESGVIRPVIDKVLPFENTGEALAYVELGRTKGKVVVDMRPGK